MCRIRNDFIISSYTDKYDWCLDYLRHLTIREINYIIFEYGFRDALYITYELFGESIFIINNIDQLDTLYYLIAFAIILELISN